MTFDVYWGDTLAGRFTGTEFEQYLHNLKLDCYFSGSCEELLLDRVMPKSRWRQEYADAYGIPDWDPLAICKRTHGFTCSDSLWLKFPDDPPSLIWEEVKSQLW